MTPRRSLFQAWFAWLLLLLLSRIGASFVMGSPSSSSPFVTTTQQVARRIQSSVKATGDANELVGTLARLDKEWKLQQRNTNTKSRRWTKLVLNREEDMEQKDILENEPTLTPPQEEAVYLLEPAGNTIPSCVLVFVGGAGLGTYPHIAYNELLLRISDRLNAAVITTPYPVGLDHFELAKRTGELARKALLQVQEDPNRLLPTNLPLYCLAHSLGCKLATIYMAATKQTYDGIGFMAYNNFGFGQTIGMAKEFATQIQESIGSGTTTMNNPQGQQIVDQIFQMAEMAMDLMQIEFTPKPADMDRIIEMKYDNSNDQDNEDRCAQTRLFSFDSDTLENTDDFVRLLGDKAPQVTRLPGTHLTPVYFQLGLDQIPDEARDFARGLSEERLGGIERASFGDESELNGLVDAICAWIKGEDKKEAPRIAAAAGTTGTSESVQ